LIEGPQLALTGPQYFNRFVSSMVSCFLPPVSSKSQRPASRRHWALIEQPISRVLYGAEAPWQSFLWERSHLRPRAAYPRRLCRRGLLLAAYLALLRRGLPCRLRCRKARWALTPPFHPYHDLLWRSVFCGTIRHGKQRRAQGLPGALPMEPGLSSRQSPKRASCDYPAAHASKYSDP